MPRIASVTAKQLTVGDPFQTKERVVARLGSLPSAAYSISSAVNNIDEGSALTIDITTTNIRNGTQLRWRILDRPNDFAVNTGLIVISSNAASFTVTPAEDFLTEGAETFRIQLEKLSGTVLTVSSAITINDTSASAWNIVPSSFTANEGDTLTYTCTLTSGSAPNGTVLTWTADTPDLTVNNDTVTVTDGSASFTVTISNDFITEGTESFTISLRSGGVDGPILGTSTAVTITDTSVETYAISAASSSINEGSALGFTVSTQGVPDSTTLYWTVSSAADFSASSGSFTITNNSGIFSVTPTADSITEGSETFTVSVRTGSSSGDIVATSSTITINDTSITPAEISLTGLSSSSYTADSSGLLFVTLDSTSQAQDIINVLFQGEETVGLANSRVRLTLTRQTGGGLISTDYLGFFDASYVSVVSGSTIRVGDWGSFERSDITSYHSQAAMAGGSVTSQAITGLSVQTGLAANAIDYLIIAGGGGGGAGGNDDNGGPGGGGAGGYRTGSNISITTDVPYTISVGGGGAAYARGGDSYISGPGITENPSGAGANTIKAYGGGHGGRDSSGGQQGASGGSGGGGGGGGWGGSYAGGAGNTPTTNPSQGNNGGSSTFFGASDGGGGGGGGGAGGVGANASGNSGGNGGIGSESPITTSVVRRAGGGGGRNRGGSGGSNGTGGAGGGGNAGSPGSGNTGSGGGALSTGGSGVVILRYPSAFTISNPGGGLTFTTNTSVSGVKITTITAGTGNIQFA